jgi:hypothetical protein
MPEIAPQPANSAKAKQAASRAAMNSWLKLAWQGTSSRKICGTAWFFASSVLALSASGTYLITEIALKSAPTKGMVVLIWILTFILASGFGLVVGMGIFSAKFELQRRRKAANKPLG